jgi:hypothetical protein
MLTITSSAATISPDLSVGYSWDSASQNIVHRLLTNPEPIITLRPAEPRSGTLTLLFRDDAAALECERIHKLAEVFTLTDTTRPGADMRYVVDGRVGVELDPSTGHIWIVTVDFQALE